MSCWNNLGKYKYFGDKKIQTHLKTTYAIKDTTLSNKSD